MGCVANATPFLNKTAGEENWKVDIQNPDKILEVKTEGALQVGDIIKAVEEAGYKAVPVH